jgi:hypothetical protein
MTGGEAFALVIGNTIENAMRIIYFVPDGTIRAKYLPSGDAIRSGWWNFAAGRLCLTALSNGMEVTDCVLISLVGSTVSLSHEENTPGEEFTIARGNARSL